jgi:hypothetical protein
MLSIRDRTQLPRVGCHVLWAQCLLAVMPDWKDIKTWTEHLGHSRLRSFTDREGHFWLEQNASKGSKWAKLAREGHEVAWEFDSPGGSYTGRLLIDGEIYSTSEATKKFLKSRRAD